MDKIKEIISLNEKKTKDAILTFALKLTFDIVMAMTMTIWAIDYYNRGDITKGVVETILAILWLACIVLDIDLVLHKIKSNNNLMSIFVQSEIYCQKELLVKELEKAVEIFEKEEEQK